MSETLSVLLQRAGLELTPDEYASLERNLPVFSSWIDALHIEAARAAEPATVYRAGWLTARRASVIES